MTALKIVLQKYKGTKITSTPTTGIKNYGLINNLDCNCIDCDDTADCSTPW